MFVLGCFVCLCAIFLWSRDLGSVSSQLFPFLSSSLFCSLFPDEAQRLSAVHRLPGTISHFSTEKFIKEESKQLLINKNEPKNSQMENLYPVQDSHTFNTDSFSPLLNINESVAISKNFQPSFGRPGQTQRTQKIQSDIRNWFQQCSTSDLGGQGTKTKTYLIAFGFHPWR